MNETKTEFYMSIGFDKSPTLFKLAKGIELIKIAESKIHCISQWNHIDTIFFDLTQQRERIESLQKARERLKSYCQNQCIILLTQI